MNSLPAFCVRHSVFRYRTFTLRLPCRRFVTFYISALEILLLTYLLTYLLAAIITAGLQKAKNRSFYTFPEASRPIAMSVSLYSLFTPTLTDLRQQLTRSTKNLDADVVPASSAVVVAAFSAAAGAPPCPTVSAVRTLTDLLPALQHRNRK